MNEHDTRTAEAIRRAQEEMRLNGPTNDAYNLLDRALVLYRQRGTQS